MTTAERNPAHRQKVRDVVEAQHGLATVAQLLIAGLTRAELRARLEREWCYVLPHVVSATRAPLDDHQRLVAALLMCGPGAVIASNTAAGYHGVKSASIDRRVRVAIPASRRVVARGFVVVKRTTRPDTRAWHRHGLILSAPARAVADAAREGDDATARAVVLEAVQRRIVTVSALEHELDAGERQGSRRLRAALADAARGAWSVPEADLARLVETSSILPVMWANPRLTTSDGRRLPTPDGWFDDVALAVQVHSKRYHAGDLDWEATVAGDGVFAEHGVPVVAVTPRQIALERGLVLRRTERAYEQAALRPRPAVRAVPIACVA